MANKYTDFAPAQSEYTKAAEYYDDNAIILAVKNILLSRPGNFPFNPSIGMDIRQYQFELLDDKMISNIRKELDKQISKYIPDIGEVEVQVRKVDDDYGKAYLCFSIFANINGDDISENLVLSNNGTTIDVFNETF